MLNKIIDRFIRLNFLAKVIIVVILLVLVYISYKRIFTANQTPGYQTAKVERGAIVSSLSASGIVAAVGRLTLSTQATGIVNNVYVKNGQTVSAGQKILSITLDQATLAKNASSWNSYLSARTTLDSANANFYTLRSKKDTAWKKFYDLSTSSTYQNSDGTPRDDIRTSSAEFQSFQADWLTAEAAYKNQQAVVSEAQAGIYSNWLTYQQTSPDVVTPVTGVITDIVLTPGMVISSDTSTDGSSPQKVASIHTNETPVITINVAEADVPKVAEGQKATITLDALPDKTFTGSVVGIDRTGVVSSGVTNYPATVRLDTIPPEVLPNMSATVNVITASRDNALLVPSEAIATANGQSAVKVVKKGQVETIIIETGLVSDTQTEIISGVNEGDEVVTGTTSTTTTTSGSSPFGTFRGMGGPGLAPGGRVEIRH